MNPQPNQPNPAYPGGGYQPDQLPAPVPAPQGGQPQQTPRNSGGLVVSQRSIDGISPSVPTRQQPVDISSIDAAKLPGLHTPSAPLSAPLQPSAPPQQQYQSAAPIQYQTPQTAQRPMGPAGVQGYQQNNGVQVSDIVPHNTRSFREQSAQNQVDPEQLKLYEQRLKAIEQSLFNQQQYAQQQAQQAVPGPMPQPPQQDIQTVQPVQPVRPEPAPVQVTPAPAAPAYQPPVRPTDFMETTEPPQQVIQRVTSPDQSLSEQIEKQPKNDIISSGAGGKSFLTMPDFGKIARSMASVMGLILLVWGGAAMLNAFIFQSYYVDGLSMTPTLHDNDRLIISRVEKTGSDISKHPYVPQRGQIVVIDSAVSPLTANRDEQLIKRVVGLPGEIIIIQNGHVIIKNESRPNGFDADHELNLDVPDTYIDSPLTITVPDGHVFVLGDNRGPNGSYDSRSFGPVPVEMIEGRLWVRVLPFDQLKVF